MSLPRASVLVKLGDHDRWAVLDAHARAVNEQIVGLTNGHMWTTGGLTKTQALGNLRRQLKRVYRVAGEFGCNVEQPAA